MLASLFQSKKAQSKEISQLFDKKTVVIQEREQPPEMVLERHVEEKQEQERAEEEDRKARTVFVGNLAVETLKKDVIALFKQYGEIEKLWFRSVPILREEKKKVPIRAQVILKKYIEGEQAKTCYILFTTAEAAKQAAKSQDGQLYKNLHLRCTLDGQKKHDHTKTVFIGNLPFSVQEEEVRQHFEQFGNISYVRLIRDSFTHRGKGFGYVSFSEFAGFKKAIQSGTVLIQEREVRITKAQPDEALNKKPQPEVPVEGARRRIKDKPKVKAQIEKKIRKMKKKNYKPNEIKGEVDKLRQQALDKKLKKDTNIFNM